MIRRRFAALPADERKALTLCIFAAACICFAPAELISGTLLIVLSYVLYRWDGQILAQERAASADAMAAGPSPVEEGEAQKSEG